MYVEPICFRDSEIYNISDFIDIACELHEYPEICVIYEKVFQFKFTGVIIINDMPIIIFPKNYKLPQHSKDILEQARILIRVFLRYKNEPIHESVENKFLFGDNKNSNARITTAIRIMEDYKMYGYIHRELIVTSNKRKGRVDWKTTISKTIPVINHNSVVYDVPITRCSMMDSENIVYRLHRYVVAQCVKMWGWLFGIVLSTEMEYEKLPCSISEAIFLLQSELRNVYVQREINVMKMMISYLIAQNGTDKKLNKEILGTQYFSFIWESICGYLFNNKYSLLSDLIPQPEWESDIVSGKISQRPDILVVDSSYLYILDAKYYNFKSKLPGWHDVVKQLFYRHTVILNLIKKKGIKPIQKDIEVKNIFLFPGDEEELLQYIGRVFVKEIDDLGEIKAFAINQKKAMETYAFRNNDDYRKQLLLRLKEIV